MRVYSLLKSVYKNKSRFVAVSVLTLLFLSMFASLNFHTIQLVSASPDWLAGWNHRKSHVVNAASGAGTNYQVKIIAHYGSGTDYNNNTAIPPEGHVYFNSQCRTDFGDVRFTGSDGTTLLDYWMEEKVDSDYAIFWVEVADDLSSDNATIYVYYGKSDATTTSNIDNTFIFGDDFRLDSAINTTKWTTVGDPTISFDSTNGLTMTKADSLAFLRSNNAYDFSSHKKVISEFKISEIYYYDAGIYVCPTLSTNPYNENNWVRSAAGGNVFLQKKVSGYAPTLSIIGLNPTVMHKHILILKVASTGYLKWVLDGTQQYSNSAEGLYTTTSNYLYPYVSVASGYTRSLVMKYVAIAKHADPEPSHGSWGSEETQITLIVHSPSQGYNYNGSFLVNITASSGGAPIDKIWFNVKNGTDWVYSQNQTYTAPITKTGYAKGFYSFYAWANNTFATVGVNFTFSSQIETLRANGSKILDKDNNIVLLRGVNKVEFADDPDGIWMGSTYWDDNNVKAELDAMKSWG